MRIPGNRGNGKTLRLADDYKENAFSIDENLVQPGFIETYSIPLIKGRTFRDNPESDKRSILVNETTVKKLGVSDPIGKEVMNGGFRCKIIGVFKDCHFRSLHHKIQPFILSRRLERNYWISIRVREGMIKDAIDYTRNVLEDYDPQYSFQHLFVKDYLDRNYRSDQKTLTLILSGTLLAILISIMGLFALTAFNIERRNKEIGIRKSLGATSSRIIKMFLFHYLKWILISAFIAFPLSYWFMERWLRNFAYHSDIEWWFFGSALMISILVAGITILIKAFQAANKNPVNTLRYE
jgi:ABC-type antimicrobial peptide transport system permease subunit